MLRIWEKLPFKFHFSTRMIGVYSLIVLVPLIVFFAVAIVRNWTDAVGLMNREGEALVEQNMSHVKARIQDVHNVETILRTNDSLLFFLLRPEEYDESERIQIVREEVSNIERMLAVSPVYTVRVFVENEAVEERFPILLHSSRADVSALPYLAFDYTAGYMDTLGSSRISSVCATSRLSKSRHNIGWLQVAVGMADFFPFLFAPKEQYKDNYAFFIQSDGAERHLVPIENSASREKSVPLSQKELASLEALCLSAPSSQGGIRYIKSGLVRKMAAYRTDLQEGIVVARIFSLSGVYRTFFLQAALTVLALAISCFLIILLVKRITRRMLGGIYALMDGMEQVRKGDIDVRLAEGGDDEVALAKRNFNAMAGQLRTQIEQIRLEQQIITDTEMKALQNQINAHFLYNVLETIRMQAELFDAEPVAESITALGKMMRYCLRWRVHQVTVEKELEYIRAYIYILNVRNDYEITLKADIPAEYMGTHIPKMLLQPLVENAFYHAIEPQEKDAEICIYARADEKEEKLWLCVQDFGPGMKSTQVEGILGYLAQTKYEEEREGHIGIKNIQQRLFMFYGEDFSIRIDSKEGKGTTVQVPVPLHGRKNDDHSRG